MGLARIFATVCALGVTAIHAPLEFAAPRADTCIPVEQCCKICSKGKACGNTCISQSYTCHKGRGCACNASEVCE